MSKINWSYRIPRVVLILILLALFILTGVKPVYSVSVVVNTTSDDEDNDDSYCSLREAIIAIQNNKDYYYGCVGGDVSSFITFDQNGVDQYIYTITKQLPSINTEITIIGESAATTIIQASDCNPTTDTCTNDHELFWVTSAGELTLENLTFRNGQNIGDLNGGVIYNAGDLYISDSVFTANRGTLGGAIYNAYRMSVSDSTFADNVAQNTGGYYDGGAIANDVIAWANIERCTFMGNMARFGGAIRNNGELQTSNSTFSANTATISGGAIFNSSTLIVTHNTFSGNTSAFGGAGIENLEDSTLTYSNTIIANSNVGADCNTDGTIGSNNNNLVEDGSCSAAFSGDPLLGPLADNGGPTQTHALLYGSTAIDMVPSTFCYAIDQRGVTRPQGEACDIGAYELEQFALFLPIIMK